MIRTTLTAVLLLLAVQPAAVRAQETAAAPDSCAQRRIASITIDNTSIFEADDPDLDSRLRWAYRAANRLHIRTRESVLRRELLFREGDCFDPFLLAETARLLRGYDFLNRAEIDTTRTASGDVDVVIDTQDDWSTRVDLRLRLEEGLQLEGVSLNEENLLGTGQRVGAFFFEREVTREYGLHYFTPQLLASRWDLAVAAGRTRPGSFLREEIAYPFVGEVGSWGGRQSFQRNDRFFNYIAVDDRELESPHVLLPVREKFFDIAAVRRIGRRGNMALLGLGLSHQELSYPGITEVAPAGDFDDRVPADSAQMATIAQQRGALDNVRVSLLLGHRNVWWTERRGLDALRGVQDVKLGAEAGLALGRSLSSIGDDNDLYVTFSMYTGFDIGSALVVTHARGDVRRDLDAPADDVEWKDLYGEAEVLAYWQLGALPRHTILLRGSGLAGWNTRTPFQLTLGGERSLRGYHTERFPGGRRAVFNVEHRFYMGWPFRDLLDLGTTVFADVGRIWPGDAPFGIDSGWRSSAGIGLRGAFPAGGRSTYRIDFAWPLERGTGLGDFRVRFTIGEVLGLTPTGIDLQFLRSRPQSVAGSIFQFRN